MNKIIDLFTKSLFGGFVGISLIHSFLYLIIKILDKTGFLLKNFFNGVFHLGRTMVVGFLPFISALVRSPMPDKTGFTFQNWYSQYFYVWLIMCIIFSFIFSSACYFICNSKNSIGKDMQPTWWLFTFILVVFSLVGGIIFTPMLNSIFPLLTTYLIYIMVAYVPFYISTLLLCGFTAKGAYTIKNKIFGE